VRGSAGLILLIKLTSAYQAGLAGIIFVASVPAFFLYATIYHMMHFVSDHALGDVAPLFYESFILGVLDIG
jgi:hypothetical protein